MAREMIERSDLLASPLFWAMWYYLQIGTDEQDGSELVQPLFGLSNDDVNQFFLSQIDSVGENEEASSASESHFREVSLWESSSIATSTAMS